MRTSARWRAPYIAASWASRAEASARYTDPLQSQRAVWIDAGTRHDWYLDLAETAFSDELAKSASPDVHFELFDATHMGIDYRYPKSLAYLSERLR